MNILTNSSQLPEFYKWLQAQTIIGFDTETNGLDFNVNNILLMQVGTEEKQYVFKCGELGHKNCIEIAKAIAAADCTKVMHNVKFDYGMVLSNYGVRIEKVVDTLIASKLLNAGKNIEHNLKEVLEKYVGVKLKKAMQTSFVNMKLSDSLSTAQVTYASLDIKYLVTLYHKLEEYIKLYDMEELATIEYECAKVTAEMEIEGADIDETAWLALHKIATKEAEEVKQLLDSYFEPYCEKDLWGTPVINYSSPKQLKPILEDLTGLELDSTSANVLEALSVEFDAIKCLLKYRKFNKLITTYGQSFLDSNINKTTKRLHTSFNQLGADSGRFSSSGPNLQNIPKSQEYRKPFIAPPGYKLICADYSNQEVRLLIHLSKDPGLLKALAEGKDLHSYSASLLFDIPYEDFLEYGPDGKPLIDKAGDIVIKPAMKKKYRNPAKSITFGLIYGMGVAKLGNTLKIPIDEAKALMKKYFQIFPSIKKLMDTFVNRLLETKVAYSPLDHRRRDLSNADWDNPKSVAHAKNISKNLPFQGAGATITKLAMCKLRRAFLDLNLDAKIILTVHDELVVKAKAEIADQVAELVQEKMIAAFEHFAPGTPMKVEPDINTYWVH